MIAVRTTVIAIVALAIAALIAGFPNATTPAASQEEAPTPTLIPTVGLFHVPLSLDDPIITWERVTGAASYQLAGTIRALRVNAGDPCTPPLRHDNRTITLDERLDGNATEFALPLPTLPEEDVWMIWDADIEFHALDDAGLVIAADGAGGIAETNFMCPTATAPRVLPATGSSGEGNGAPITVPLACLAAAIISLCVALGTAVWRRHAE